MVNLDKIKGSSDAIMTIIVAQLILKMNWPFNKVTA